MTCKYKEIQACPIPPLLFLSNIQLSSLCTFKCQVLEFVLPDLLQFYEITWKISKISASITLLVYKTQLICNQCRRVLFFKFQARPLGIACEIVGPISDQPFSIRNFIFCLNYRFKGLRLGR